MWFRQLSFYLLDEKNPVDVAKLANTLENKPFHPCGGLEWSSEGWIWPAGHAESPVLSSKQCHLVTLKREDKVLPAGVVRDFVDAKVAEIEDKEVRKVGRKEKQALKEQVTDDLLPRAFTRSSRQSAYLDLNRQYLMVDSASSSRAEALVSALREAQPPFPARLPRTQLSPATAMTDWVASGLIDTVFELDNECELKAPGENGAVVRMTRMDLTSDEVRQHLASGKQVTRLALVWRERIRFVLTETLQLKRLQFLDVLQEEASQAGDDMASLVDATFLLMSAELGQLVDELIEVLGGLQGEA